MGVSKMQYDEKIIEKHAKKLYQQANSTIIAWSLLFLLLGAGISVGLAAVLDSEPTIWVAVGAIIGGLFGYSAGSARAFSLKLTAQTALCQMQIERNTRSAARED